MGGGIVDAGKPVAAVPGAKTRIQSVSRAARVLLWIADQPQGATVKEIAAAQGLALPTTYHLVNTLVDEGLLGRDVHRRYVLGPSVGALADAHRRAATVPEALVGAVRELARRTGETVYLADWRDGEIRVLASVEGNQTVRVAEVASGPYDHGHSRANGKVLLAYAAPEARDAYLAAHPLVRLTERTICDASQFERELEQIRERGFSLDDEEYAAGVSCLAAPILNDGRLVAAMGLSVPTQRFRERLPDLKVALRETISALAVRGLASSPGFDA